MAKLVHPENSKYFVPAVLCGRRMGLSKLRATALALRIVDRAANGGYTSPNEPYWMASNVWEHMEMVKVTKQETHGKKGQPCYFTCPVQIHAIPASIVNYVIKTRESTWKKWEAVARAMGLV